MRPLLRSSIIITGIMLFFPLISVSADINPEEPGVANSTCLQCHSDPNLNMTLEDGSQLSLYIDVETYDNSIHGSEGYACVQCHRNLGEYPHPDFSAVDKRDVALQLYNACEFCHSGQYEKTLDSVHEQARVLGNREAAICTDCHGAHNTQRLTGPETRDLLPEARIRIPQTCAQCHSLIYDKYRDSIHGSALIGEGNPDVPTCIDCHGVHSIGDPRTNTFRLNSPIICSSCHTDPKRMAKYGISTDVLNTYVADFHGTTITLFEKMSPDAVSNKPVCYDCHGVHDIRPVEDPEKGLQVRENLLARCQECHPDATANFSDAWLSHYIPSPDRNSLVYFVNLFYKIFIPATLGGMALLVVLDASRKVRDRWGGKDRITLSVEDISDEEMHPIDETTTNAVQEDLEGEDQSLEVPPLAAPEEIQEDTQSGEDQPKPTKTQDMDETNEEVEHD